MNLTSFEVLQSSLFVKVQHLKVINNLIINSVIVFAIIKSLEDLKVMKSLT